MLTSTSSQTIEPPVRAERTMQPSMSRHFTAWPRALLLAALVACATHRTGAPTVDDEAKTTPQRPTPLRVLDAPQGTLRIEEIETPGKSKPRSLRLVESTTQDVRWEYDFEGKVDVLWAPDAAALAITNWIGEGIAVLTVVETKPPNRTYLLNDLVPQDAHVTDNEQVWVEGTRWIDPRHLEFRLRGRGRHDPNGFERSFLYAVGGAVEASTGTTSSLGAAGCNDDAECRDRARSPSGR